MNKSKEFGLTFFVVFLLVFLYLFFFGDKFNIYILALSFIFLILGILESKVLMPLYKAWMLIGKYVGKIISPIVIFLIYFTVILFTNILLKIFRKDILALKFDSSKDSYWVKRQDFKIDMDNQF